MDMDRTPESRELGATFRASRYFEIAALPEVDIAILDILSFD